MMETRKIVPYLKLFALYQKVETAVKFLSCYSESLILNHTNNPAEQFNSIICKLIAGKRINFGARGSYNARIAGAVLQHNTQQVLTQLHENMGSSVPIIAENLEKRRQIHIAKKKEFRKVEGKEKKVKREVGTDRYYGPQSQREDISSEAYEQLKKHHMDVLLENGRNWQKIEFETRGQSDSELWHTLRKQMLTASNFGVVCRMRATTSCAMTVKHILYPPYIDTAAMKYGQEMEEIARKELAVQLKKKITKCGLFIDKENPCLGASPDGLIDEDGLVEIKCPLSAETLTAEEALKTLPQLKSTFDKKDLNKLNHTHKFFYQVQGQLNITQRDYCIFAVWTPKSMKTVHVRRKNDFWKNQMLPKLTRFYYECMLPEILDSRHNRHMPIRNPSYIVEAQQQACEKVAAREKKKRENMNNKHMQNKRVKYNNNPTETKSATYIVTCTQDQDDECIVTNHFRKEHLTEAEIISRRKLLDQMIIPLSVAKENILSKDSRLDDQSLDLFLRVVREKSSFETQSVYYIESPQIIAACSKKSVQIIGGRCTGHWRCIFFDEKLLHVYDSLPGCTYDRLAQEEKDYIAARFPQITPKDIIFEKVQAQPDGNSCGIYAAAFATDVVLGINPCKEHYSNDVETYMRRHLYNIVEKRELLPFPRK